MVTHDGVGRDIDGEYFSQQRQAFNQPGLAMIEAFAGEMVFAAQECSPHAAGNAVGVKCGLQRQQSSQPSRIKPAWFYSQSANLFASSLVFGREIFTLPVHVQNLSQVWLPTPA